MSNRGIRTFVFVIVLALLPCLAVAAEPMIWIEAEDFTEANFEPKTLSSQPITPFTTAHPCTSQECTRADRMQWP